MASIYQHRIYSLRNSVLPVVLFWMSVLAGLAVAESRNWMPRWLLYLITAPAAFSALIQLGHGFLRLVWAAKTYRRHLPKLVLRMLGLFPKLSRFRTEMAKIIVHIGLAVLSLVISNIFGLYSVLGLAALFLGITVTVSLRALLPPGGVYLASSDPERIRFFGQLSLRTIPALAALLEVSSFLDPEESLRNYMGDAVGLLNDYRTTQAADWPNVARQLIEVAAVVVVDGRDQTAGVRFEVERILKNHLEFKTVFLSSDGHMPPLLSFLSAKSSHPSGTFQILSPDVALNVVPQLINYAEVSWIPVRLDN